MKFNERTRPVTVEMTWFSIANWYFKIGELGIMMDGYISRVPKDLFYGGGKGLAYTHTAFPANRKDVTAVHRALSSYGPIDYILAGHSHFDHTFDTAIWQQLTGAPVIGGLSTQYQCQAYGIGAERVNVVQGRERIELAPGVTVYVIRFNHSGSHAENPEQHDPVELRNIPVADPASGGFRAGVAEDYPNGGGGRAFLFKIDNPGERPLSVFVQDSASTADLTENIVVDGVDYGAPLANLRQAMLDAGLSSVDVWIATNQAGLAELVVPVVKPRYYIPSHWDGLFAPFFAGMPFPYATNPTDAAYLEASKIPVLPQSQYFDTYVLGIDGNVKKKSKSEPLKQPMGFDEVQRFNRETNAMFRAGMFFNLKTCCG